MIHFRNRKKFLYGRPLFGQECFGAWENLKSANEALAKASVEIGYNPTIHIMPKGADKKYKDSYKQDHENQLSQGAVTHYYLEPEADIKKLSLFDPDLKALIESILLWRSTIITRSRLPLWMFSGFTALNGNTSKEISEQPSLAYSRQINSFRMELSEGIKQLCLTELILKGVPEEKRKFRIVHPKIFVSTNQLMNPDKQEESDPTNPADNTPNAKATQKKPTAKQSSKSTGDSLEFLQEMSKDQLLKIFSQQ